MLFFMHRSTRKQQQDCAMLALANCLATHVLHCHMDEKEAEPLANVEDRLMCSVKAPNMLFNKLANLFNDRHLLLP